MDVGWTILTRTEEFTRFSQFLGVLLSRCSPYLGASPSCGRPNLATILASGDEEPMHNPG